MATRKTSPAPNSIFRRVLAELALLFLGIWAYWPALTNVYKSWLSNPDYTHGFLVIPIACWFLWLRWNELPSSSSKLHWESLGVFALAGLVRYFAGRFYLPELDAWSIPLWIGGIVLLFHGRPVLRWALPSIAFLWFATPLPGTIEIALSTPLQKVATELSGWSLRLLGQPAIAEGTTILLDDHVLDVERACSGLRMFYGIFALAVACVTVARPARWKALFLLISTVPIAIAANVFRVSVTGLLTKYVSGEAAQNYSHDMAGLLMIPVAVLLFVMLLTLTNKVSSQLQSDVGGGLVWLLRWGVIAGVLLAGVLLWGNYQQKSAYGTLLYTAQRYELQEDWPNAAVYLHRYVVAHPEDHNGLVHLAEVYNKVAISHREKLRAIAISESAWKKVPARTDLALQAAGNAMEVNKYRMALRVSDQLLSMALSFDDRKAAVLLRADAMQGYLQDDTARDDYSWQNVANALEAACQLKEAEIRHWVALAEVWRERLSSPDKPTRMKHSDEVIDRMVADHADDPLAWLARFHFCRKYAIPGDEAIPMRADADLKHALSIIDQADDADKVDIYLSAATRAQELEESAKTESYLRLAIASSPTDHRAIVALAEYKRSAGDKASLEEAISLLHEGLTTIGTQEVSLLLPLASLLAETGDLSTAEDKLETIEEMIPHLTGPTQSLVRLGAGLVRTQIIAQRDGIHPAIRFLKSILTDTDIRLQRQQLPRLLAKGHSMLGELYTSISSHDQAIDHFQLAIQLDPGAKELRISAAASALQTGHLDGAEFHFRKMLKDNPTFGEGWLALASIQVRQQLLRPIGARNWVEVNRSHRRARECHVSELSLKLAEVELESAQGNLENAQHLLSDAAQQWPEEPAIWRAMAVIQDRAGREGPSLEATKKYLHLTPNEIEPYVLRTTLLAKANRSSEALAVLTGLMDTVSSERWAEVALECARLQLLLGHVEEAKSVLEDTHAKVPDNLRNIDTLANLAWLSADWQKLERCEGWLHDVEGRSGTLWRLYRALRLLGNVTAASDQELEEAKRLGDVIHSLRPNWHRAYFLRGSIALQEGRTDAAVVAFQEAWRLGDRSVLLTDRLVDLLTRQARFAEAQGYVTKIREYLSLPSRLIDRAVPYYLRGDDRVEALRLAEARVEHHPDDSTAHLRLGRVLLIMLEDTDSDNQPYLTRAEAAFKAAIRLAPNDVQTWIASAMFYSQTKGTLEQAIAVLHEFANQVDIDAFTRTYLLAQLHESISNPVEAQRYYCRAIQMAQQQKTPAEQVDILCRAAHFYLQRVPFLAELYARKALALDMYSEPARQALLTILANREETESVHEALAILDKFPSSNHSSLSPTDRRIRAKLLLQQNEPTGLLTAIDLLESQPQKTADDNLLLAAIYERTERLDSAFEILSEAVRESPPRLQDEVAFLKFWQTHFLANATDNIKTTFSSVAKSVYDDMAATPGKHAAWLRWKIRELKKTQDIQQLSSSHVQPLLVELIESNESVKQLPRESKLGWIRPLLLVLLRENAQEAVLHFVTDPPDWLSNEDATVAFCHALILAPAENELYLQANDLLDSMLDKHPEKASLAQSIGDYLFMTSQYTLATTAYRTALSIEPDRHLARNNLALALAEQPGRLEDARLVLDEALRQNEADPVLMDTKAILELIDGRAVDALQLLDRLMASNPKDAMARLHAAMGYQMTGENERMQASFLEAMGLGVKSALLSPRDRHFLREMWQNCLSTEHTNKNDLLSKSAPNHELPVLVTH